MYNILCDSIGMAPMPNNGTLRLPLRPIGLHSEPGLDTPADPVSSYTVTSEAPPTPTPTPSPSSTKLVQVDPVTSSSVESPAPTATVGVDHPDAQPSENPADDGEGDEDDEKSQLEKVGQSAKDFWDWFTGKIGEWWDKLSGGEQKNSGEDSS